MACGIYKITNLINNHCYIGQSVNIAKRWVREKSDANNINSESYNTALSRAFRKYGIENFSFEIIEECDQTVLNEREKYWITYYDSHHNGYNSTDGGDGNLNLEVKISYENLMIIYDLLQNSKISQREIARQFNVGEDVISTINHGKSRRQDGYSYPLRNNRSKQYICCDCGTSITYKAVRCSKCEKIKQRKTEWPSREELKQMIFTEPFVKIAARYNVSDKAIVHWCEYYSLPSRKKDIKKYSQEEWQSV